MRRGGGHIHDLRRRRVGLDLVFELGLEELSVEAGDVGYGDSLRALGLASSGVCAIAEAELVHLGHHSLGAARGLDTALREEGQLAHLGRDEEHGGAVFASRRASAAAYAAGGVHGLVCGLFGDGEGVGVLRRAAADGGVATGLHDLVIGRAVDHKVADHGEAGRTPRLDGDGLTVGEAAHMELAGGGVAVAAVRVAVDVERAHAADALAAVVVEHHGLLMLGHELLVEGVEHLEERHVGGDVLEIVGLEMAFLLRSFLTPDLERDVYSFIHCE